MRRSRLVQLVGGAIMVASLLMPLGDEGKEMARSRVVGVKIGG